MISMRAWLVSGMFAAGLSAGMICGAGLAAADAGTDSGSAGSSPRSAAESSRTPGGVSRVSVLNVRPGATTPPRTRAARVGTAKPANTVPELSAVTLGADSIASALAAPVVASASSAALPASASPPSAAPRRVAGARKTGSGASLIGLGSLAAITATTQAAAQPVPVVPSSVPVDPAEFAGTYYEQGSVKQFFSFGLVNTKAEYTLNPDGTIRVENSGNYFFNRGPRSSIVGSAVVVNATNTALNVGFSPFSAPSASPPGNYTILANAPDYSWVIVSDPSGRSGYILTRSKTISGSEYRQLLDRARSLGVQGRITPTIQYA